MLERTVWALTNQLKAGDFVPEAYELRFFGGKIDRVDVCETEEQVYVKVIRKCPYCAFQHLFHPDDQLFLRAYFIIGSRIRL